MRSVRVSCFLSRPFDSLSRKAAALLVSSKKERLSQKRINRLIMHCILDALASLVFVESN